MTHDELLAKINKPQALSIQYIGLASEIEILTLIAFRNALSAVVKLHKPIQDKKLWCEGCRVEDDDWYSTKYPCPTIQAIEVKLA